MSMGKAPGPSAESIELERLALEREKQLRVENAKEKTKTFSDNVAFRKKLRGVFALLSGGFSGFPSALGVSTSRGGGGGGGSQAGSAFRGNSSGRSSLGLPSNARSSPAAAAAGGANSSGPSTGVSGLGGGTSTISIGQRRAAAHMRARNPRTGLR